MTQISNEAVASSWLMKNVSYVHFEKLLDKAKKRTSFGVDHYVCKMSRCNYTGGVIQNTPPAMQFMDKSKLEDTCDVNILIGHIFWICKQIQAS